MSFEKIIGGIHDRLNDDRTFNFSFRILFSVMVRPCLSNISDSQYIKKSCKDTYIDGHCFNSHVEFIFQFSMLF